MTAAAIFGLAGLLALGKKLIDLARMLTNWRTEKSGVVTQVAAFGVFVGLVFLFGAAQTGTRIELVPGLSLSDLNGWAKVVLGLMLGSGGSLVADYLQAKDQHDSQALPPLRFPSMPSVGRHPAEPDSEGGPILADAVVTVRPVLDPSGVDAMRSQLEDALRPVADGVVADATARLLQAHATVTAPEPPAEPPAG